MAGDRQQLLDMGFPVEKVDRAVKATGNAGMQAMMDWILEHGEEAPTATSMAATTSMAAASPPQTEEGEATAAEAHAIKTSHSNFSESADAIKPLTPEERAQKLAELTARIAIKKEARAKAEAVEAKENVKIQRTSAKEVAESKERFEKAEMAKIVLERKREKEADLAAKLRIKSMIEQDRKDREAAKKLKDDAKAGKTVEVIAPLASVAAVPLIKKDYLETRIQVLLLTFTLNSEIKFLDGKVLVQTFPVSAKLAEVLKYAQENSGGAVVVKLMQPYPRKVLDEMDKSLGDIGLAPSASLVAQ